MIGALVLLAAAVGPAEIGVPPRLISGTITSADYPRDALKRNAQGVTKVRLTITAEGRAINCSLFQSSGDAELDAKVCPLTTIRMRFSPALDREGKPVPIAAILPVRWMIDPSAPPAEKKQD